MEGQNKALQTPINYYSEGKSSGKKKSSKSPEITYANGLTASWKHENTAPTTILVECLVAFIKVCMGPIT